jgi:hypothetical protein
MPKSVLSFYHPLFRKDTPDLSKEMNMAPSVSGGATATEGKKKAKEGQPVGAAPTAVAQLPAAMVASISPLAAASAVVCDPAPSNTAVSVNTMTQPADMNGLLGLLRTQIAAETAATELLLQQALQAASQHQQEQHRQDAAALFAQALAQTNGSNNHYNNNPINLLQATTSNNSLLQGLLSTLVGNSQLQVAPQQQQLRQQQQQLHLQVPQRQFQLQIQQLRLPQLNTTSTVTPSQLVSLASALAAGVGSAAPVPQQQPSQANILQSLTPQHQLALLSQVTSSSQNATNSNN